MPDDNSGQPVHPIVLNAEHAPVLYFEASPSVAHGGGVYTIVLSVGRPIPMNDGSVPTAHTAVCVLKCNLQALEGLRSTIDNAILLGVKAEGKAN